MAKKSKETARQKPPGKPAAGADLSHLERMLAFMEQHGLEEIEYENAGLRVRLRKPSAHAHFAGASRSLASLAPPEILFSNPPAGSEAAGEVSTSAVRPGETGEAGRAEAAGENLHVVKSPIVGTFYEGGSPGAEPFVKIGDQVTSGQVLCIIEAMKLMNEIESDVAGEIVRRYVENGQPVEYGESLFAIRASRKK